MSRQGRSGSQTPRRALGAFQPVFDQYPTRYNLPPPPPMFGPPGYGRTEYGYRAPHMDRGNINRNWRSKDWTGGGMWTKSKPTGTKNKVGRHDKVASGDSQPPTDQPAPSDQNTDQPEGESNQPVSESNLPDNETNFLSPFTESKEEQARASVMLAYFLKDVSIRLGDETMEQMFSTIQAKTDNLYGEEGQRSSTSEGAGEASAVPEWYKRMAFFAQAQANNSSSQRDPNPRRTNIDGKGPEECCDESVFDVLGSLREEEFDGPTGELIRRLREGKVSSQHQTAPSHQHPPSQHQFHPQPPSEPLPPAHQPHSDQASETHTTHPTHHPQAQAPPQAHDIQRERAEAIRNAMKTVVTPEDDVKVIWENIQKGRYERPQALKHIQVLFKKYNNRWISEAEAEECYRSFLNKDCLSESESHKGESSIPNPRESTPKQQRDTPYQPSQPAGESGPQRDTQPQAASIVETLQRLAFEDQRHVDRATAIREEDLSVLSQGVIHPDLKNIEISDFQTEGGYANYCKDVIKDLVANAAIVSRRCKQRERQTQVSSDDIQRGRQTSNVPSSGNDQPRPRAVDFPGQPLGDTYIIDRQNPQGESGPTASTPYVPYRNRLDRLSQVCYEETLYNQYQIPPEYRRTIDQTDPIHSSTIGGDPTPGKTNSATLLSFISALPVGQSADLFKPFDGKKSSFLEWKSMTQVVLESLPETYRPIKLKTLLPPDAQDLVAHILYNDVNATERIWKELSEHYGGSIEQADFHMDQLMGWVRDGKRCKDYKSLLHLYNYIKKHYYGIVRLGAAKVPMAEGFAYAIAPLLYGYSQREVNKLKHSRTASFNVGKILEIIKAHMETEKAKEADYATYTHVSDHYSEQDQPYLRREYRDENSKYNRSYDRDRSRKFSQETYSKRGDYQTNNRYSRSNSRDRFSSRDRYRQTSTDRQRKDSTDRYKESSGELKHRETSGDRYNSYDRNKRDNSKERYVSNRYRPDSKDRYDSYNKHSRDGSREGKTHGNIQIMAAQSRVDPPLSLTVGKPTERRSRDPTPRGSRSKSPASNRNRAVNTYKCTLHLSDSHDTLDCREYSYIEVHKIALERKLCFVCFLQGHGADRCRCEHLVCKDSNCRQDVKHNRLLCGKFKKD